jgi:hypothetical protein
MTYEQVKNLKPEDFKRLCGVRRETFNQMVSVVQAHSKPKQKTGRPGKLSLEDQSLDIFKNPKNGQDELPNP